MFSEDPDFANPSPRRQWIDGKYERLFTQAKNITADTLTCLTTIEPDIRDLTEAAEGLKHAGIRSKKLDGIQAVFGWFNQLFDQRTENIRYISNYFLLSESHNETPTVNNLRGGISYLSTTTHQIASSIDLLAGLLHQFESEVANHSLHLTDTQQKGFDQFKKLAETRGSKMIESVQILADKVDAQKGDSRGRL